MNMNPKLSSLLVRHTDGTLNVEASRAHVANALEQRLKFEQAVNGVRKSAMRDHSASG